MSPFNLYVVHHFISGDAVYTGIACLILAVAWRHFHWKGGERVVWTLVILGAACLMLSSSLMMNGGGFITEIVTLGWLLLGRSPQATKTTEVSSDHPRTTCSPKKSADSLLSLVVVLLWLFEGVLEFQWRQMPELSAECRQASLVILGDSLTAGTGDEKTILWPQRLHDQTGQEIVNWSEMGATVGSTLKKFPRKFPEKSLVIVELGGNDLLGNTSVHEFRQDLNNLLSQITAEAGETLMFELPLPPFSGGYGRAQRELAKKHKVKLIPKRVLTTVLLSNDTTLDSIHLNQSGHDQLANIVEQLLWKE
ncbi:MAG TPA: GDSL-type esterase/lipase family protein [Planctomicrobium sp.]|nr:GDSL-type esterase/lipase family protein [Planctomicrobium sp.]